MLPEAYSINYDKLSGGVFAYRSDSVVPACDGIRLPYRVVQQNAFYCPEGDFVAWDDEGLFPKISAEYGNFVLSIVLAHEWGHSIQKRSGRLYDMETIISEQQADCFAGAWAGRLGSNPADAELTALRDSDLDRSLAGLIEFRDLVGFAEMSAGGHGTAFDRIRAFQEGYEDGPSRCVAYQSNEPVLVGFSYRTIKEAIRGGNQRFDESMSTSLADLNTRGVIRRDAIEPEPMLISDSGLDLFCNELSDRTSRLTNDMMSACLDGEAQVSYRTDNMRTLHEEFGDFAPATVLAVGAAAVAVDRAVESGDIGADTNDEEHDAIVDCLAGSWAGSLIDLDYPEDSELSPGDLDESVQTLLRLASASDAAAHSGSGFARVAAFRTGVFGGAELCW
jgi:hypothetical protein